MYSTQGTCGNIKFTYDCEFAESHYAFTPDTINIMICFETPASYADKQFIWHELVKKHGPNMKYTTIRIHGEKYIWKRN